VSSFLGDLPTKQCLSVDMETADYLMANWRLVDKGTRDKLNHERMARTPSEPARPARPARRLWPTLKRSPGEAWGMSLSVGGDIGESCAHWSGVITSRGDKGIWVKVASVRPGTSADAAGLRPGDFVTRINGQIIFHLSIDNVDRIIRNSGGKLLLDIER